jgi:hypothetical protein
VRQYGGVTWKVSSIKYPDKTEEIEKLFKACLAINEKRVIVAHGLWTDDMDGLSARSVSRNSFKPIQHSFKNNELDKLSDETQRLMQAVMGFQGS